MLKRAHLPIFRGAIYPDYGSRELTRSLSYIAPLKKKASECLHRMVPHIGVFGVTLHEIRYEWTAGNDPPPLPPRFSQRSTGKRASHASPTEFLGHKGMVKDDGIDLAEIVEPSKLTGLLDLKSEQLRVVNNRRRNGLLLHLSVDALDVGFALSWPPALGPNRQSDHSHLQRRRKDAPNCH